jgi:hypothetical protein
MDNLPLQQLGSLMLHNTYDREDFLDPATRRIDLQAVYDHGIRGIELDLVKKANASEWSVSHGEDFAAGQLLSLYLDDLLQWQQATDPQNQPVVVYLDLKGDQKPEHRFPDELDAYLAKALGAARLWSPRDVLTWPGDLMQTLMARGWPTLGELRGKLVFVLSGNDGGAKQAYAASQRTRLCFTDSASFTKVSTHEGDRVLLNGAWNVIKDGAFADVTEWALRHRAILTRVYNVDGKLAWKKVARRANIVATDKAELAEGAGWWELPDHSGTP